MAIAILLKKAIAIAFSILLANSDSDLIGTYAAQGSLLFPGTLSHDDEDCYLVNVFGCSVL